MKLPPFDRFVRKNRRRRSGSLHARLGRRRLAVERLEDRHMLSAIPFGAMPDDTAEYMLGDVLVTLVLMESDGLIDASTEDWTAADVAAVEQTVAEGLAWWEDALALQNSAHSLNFILDTTYADAPVPTGYEPITRPWDAFVYWAEDFLDYVGFSTPDDLAQDMLAFNHAQRAAHGTDWAFTIFVANSTNDPDDRFELGHAFSGSFAFAGGLFFVTPSGRPASTIAHETGHVFYAKDEYPGGASYHDTRGYYDTQNLNAYDDNPDLSARVDSIMSSGVELQNAYAAHLISPSARAMIGWADSDGDGLFDVLDVPLKLQGSGTLDPATRTYRFLGQAAVQTLPNLNPSGLGNDITLNEINRVEFRVDGGDWITAEEYHAATATLDLSIAVPLGAQQIELRAIDDASGVTSEIFLADVGPAETTEQPGIDGFVWIDVNQDGQRETGEPGLAEWIVRLTQPDGAPLESPLVVEPDDYAQGTAIDHAVSGVTLSAEIIGGFSSSVGPAIHALASTGGNVFAYQAGTTWDALWTSESRRLRIDFDQPTSRVQIDVVADGNGDCGRLELYDQYGQLLARTTSDVLAAGQVATLEIARPTADVAYALVGGHLDGDVLLDNLRIGVEATARTDSLGAFRFTGLAPGTYRVEVELRSGWGNVSPPSGEAIVVVATEQSTRRADFGVYPTSAGSLWQNPANPLDVNDDGVLALNDIQWIAYELYHNGTRQLPVPTVPPNTPAPYLDANGDGFLTIADALLVVHGLTGQPVTAAVTLQPPDAPVLDTAGESTAATPIAPASPGSALTRGVGRVVTRHDGGMCSFNDGGICSLDIAGSRPGLRYQWTAWPGLVDVGPSIHYNGRYANETLPSHAKPWLRLSSEYAAPASLRDPTESSVAPIAWGRTDERANHADRNFADAAWLDDLLDAGPDHRPVSGSLDVGI